MASPQVVIVGAGVTGTLLATMLKDMGVSARILEKSRAAGGRMTTYRYRGSGGHDGDVLARADLGAQYITTRSAADHSVLAPVYDSLLRAGALVPFSAEVAGPNPYGAASSAVRHFVAPKGLQSLSEHFMAESGSDVQWSAFLRSLDVDADGVMKMDVANGSNPESDVCSAAECAAPSIVVLTQPVPQVLGGSKFGLGGNFLQQVDEKVVDGLSKVEFSSRFAVAFFFEQSAVSWPYSWTVRYFDKGDVRYVSYDSSKRTVDSEEPLLSIVVHSGVPLGIELKEEEAPFETAAAKLRADLEEKLPEIPWGSASGTKVHKWRYSQVYKGIGGNKPSPDWVWDAGTSDGGAASGFPGCVELFRTSHALGLLAGDSVAPAGNFEGCVFSAWRAAGAIRSHLQAGKSDL